MREQTKNLLIGIFVIIAISLTISIIMFLKPTVGDNKKTLYARFSNINKLKTGTQLLYAGKPVGEVVGVETIPHPREQPTDELGRFYIYQLTIKYDSSVDIFNTDEVIITTSGLLGEKSIEVIPKAPPRGVIPKPLGDDPVYADSMDAIERMFTRISMITEKLNETLCLINKWVEENGPILSQTIQAVSSTMDQIEYLVTNFNQLHILEDVKLVINKIGLVTEQIGDALAQMESDDVFINVGQTMKSLKSATQGVDTVVQEIADGKGSLGKFLMSDDFYLRVVGITSKVNTLMNDINHYGILFHLNKGWQRLRQQRISFIDSLDSPASFRKYFEEEIDAINTSMARLSIVVEKAESSPEKEEIFESEAFKRDFSDLLRDVEGLYDNLKLYNQQLLEIQNCMGD